MIEVIHIAKEYTKGKPVIEDISFRVAVNQVCCLLGKNGAGKSTIINIISQVIPQSKGEVLINGKAVTRRTVLAKEGVGIVSQFDYLIDQLTGYQYLKFQCLLLKIDPATTRQRIESLTDFFFETPGDIFRPIASYSTGMRMKIRIITALLHKPGILVLDEPFANLDPVNAEKLTAFISEFAAIDSHLVLISSHDLLYVDKIATQICVLHERRIVFDGSKNEFTRDGSIPLDQTFFQYVDAKPSSMQNISWLLKK
jgi:ABC-2 type transport system ATP-binding protein